MSKLRQGWEIYRKKGINNLISEFSYFIENRIQKYFWPEYYSVKSSILNDYIVNINNVLIDLDYEVISPTIKERFRMRSYESAETELINTYISKNQSVIDLGAGVGYTACLIDRNTNISTPIVAIEANKSLIPVIERTKDINDRDFVILHSAYDSESDSVDFQVAKDFWSSSQYDRENKNQIEDTIPAISLNEIIKKYNLKSPIQLVVDIEGGEHDLFADEYHILQNEVSLIIFEYHSFTENSLEYYSRILRENGFKFIDSQGNVYVYQNSSV